MDQGKVLLVGGAGYVGNVVAEAMSKLSYSVRCLDLLLYHQAKPHLSSESNGTFEWVQGDFCDQNVIENALDGIDHVIIFGGLVGDPITKKYPLESKSINEVGISKLIDNLAGKNLKKVVFISTCSNYGLIESDELATEEHDLNPLSLYAKAKVAAEEKISTLAEKEGFHPTILRFATAFGLSSRMRFDLTVNEFVRDLYFGKELLVYDADTWRPYCHVNDFARLLVKVLAAPNDKVSGEIFNAGGEVNNCTKRQIVDLILKHLPEAKVAYKEKGSDPRNYRPSFQKVKERLGFEPEYLVEDGISELIASLKAGNFKDSIAEPLKYGNYEINYQSVNNA